MFYRRSVDFRLFLKYLVYGLAVVLYDTTRVHMHARTQ